MRGKYKADFLLRKIQTQIISFNTILVEICIYLNKTFTC